MMTDMITPKIVYLTDPDGSAWQGEHCHLRSRGGTCYESRRYP